MGWPFVLEEDGFPESRKMCGNKKSGLRLEESVFHYPGVLLYSRKC
jgi:hypothetical protein